ncbi:MAG TPA: hypothetical protein VMF53_15520 [Alphaproteobacteria bacterium]|nr:hypothetical protein [Alphaproteobacteria bacterium]
MTGAPRPPRAESKFALATLACLAIGAYYLWLLGRYDDLVLSDYIWWMAEAMRIDDILLRHGCATAFVIKPYPVPNSFIQALLALFNVAGGWRFATSAVLALYVVAFVAAARELARASDASRGPMMLIAFIALGTGTTFWGGDLNFDFALAISMLAVADVLRGRTAPRRVAAITTLAFFVHAIGFFFVGGLYGLWALYRRAYRELVAFVPSTLLSLWYLWGRFVEYADREAFAQGSINPPWLSPHFLAFKLNTIMKTSGFMNFFVDTDAGPIYVMAREFGYAIVALGVVLSAVWAVLVASGWAPQGWRALAAVAARRAEPRQFALAYASLWAIVALLIPPHMLGVVEFAFRMLAIAMVVALLLIATGPVRRAALALVAVFFVALNVAFMSNLGDVRDYTPAPQPRVLGRAIDRVVTLFSRVGLDSTGIPFAKVLDDDACGPTTGRFTGIILPAR